MKFTMHRSAIDDKLTVHVEIDGCDYARAHFTNFDHLLIRDCEGSEKASDKLLALETIVRRIEEAKSSAATFLILEGEVMTTVTLTFATPADVAALAQKVAANASAIAAAVTSVQALASQLGLDEAQIAKLVAAATPIIPPIIIPPYDPLVQWSASFEGGTLIPPFEGQNNSGAASSSAVLASAEGIVAHSGLWMMKQSVTGIGGTRMYRYSTINSLYRTGNPIYYSFWAYFPQITTLDAGGFFNLLQIQSINANGITDPVWILGIHPSNFTLRLEWWSVSMSGPHVGETGGKAYDQLTPIPVGKWTFIEVMVTPREDFSGAVKVWQDKALLFDMSGVKTKYPESNVAAGVQSFLISKNAYGQAINPLPHAHYVDDVTISLGRMPA